MKNDVLRGMALATLAGLLYAVTAAAGVLLPRGFPLAETVWGRYGAQLLILGAFVLPFRGPAGLRSYQPRLQLLRGLMMVIMPVAFVLAMPRIGAIDAWAAVWIAPLAGMVVGRFLLGETMSRSSWLIALLATAGALAAHEPTRASSLTGLLAAVVTGGSFGAFLAITRLLKRDRVATGLFWTAACVFVCTSAVVGHTWEPLTLRALVALTVIGGLWLLVLFVIDEALRCAPLALLTPFLLTEIIWTRVLFHMPWTPRAVFGALALLLVIAVYLLTTGRGRALRLSPTGLVNA